MKTGRERNREKEKVEWFQVLSLAYLCLLLLLGGHANLFGGETERQGRDRESEGEREDVGSGRERTSEKRE